MAVCDSASCNSTSSVSVTNYVIIRQNEIKNEVYNLATKIAPFVDVQQCRVPAGKTAGYCSCVEYVRERKDIIFILCESEWNFPSGSDCYFRDRGNGNTSCGQALWWSVSKRWIDTECLCDTRRIWTMFPTNAIQDHRNGTTVSVLWDVTQYRSRLRPITFNIFGCSVQPALVA